MNEGEILDLIEREVNARQPSNFRLSVDRRGVRHEGNWWYVVVQPDKSDIRASDYNALMTQVEDAIEDQTEDVNVLLVPALPD